MTDVGNMLNSTKAAVHDDTVTAASASNNLNTVESTENSIDVPPTAATEIVSAEENISVEKKSSSVLGVSKSNDSNTLSSSEQCEEEEHHQTDNVSDSVDSMETKKAKDTVDDLQALLVKHVELFERVLLVEQDINATDNIKRLRGEESQGLVHRHMADRSPSMEVDLHADAIKRALEQTATSGTIKTTIYREGTLIRGPARDVQTMVEQLSRTFFNDLLENLDKVLEALDCVKFAVCASWINFCVIAQF